MPVPGVQYYVISVADYNTLSEYGLLDYLAGFDGPVDGFYYAAVDSGSVDPAIFDDAEVYGYDIGMMYYMYSSKWQTGV